VTGRPTAEQTAAAAEEQDEPHEDAVCMCCFDGTSVEGNRILFCDGCNATLHQVCYGVHTIPEGDFYCDRCQYIQLLAAGDSSFDYYHAKTAVMCCLCPLQHGGLKPTTDGRWVHLCCALWSPDCTIVDMTEMAPVNVSRVPVQLPIDSEAYVVGSSNSNSSNSSSFGRMQRTSSDDQGSELFRQNCLLSPLKDACMFCNLHGGRVQQCCYPTNITTSTTTTTTKCSKVFHPLCAWFEGLYMSSTIDDPTFQGASRGNTYPSGLTFCFLCDTHSVTVATSTDATATATANTTTTNTAALRPYDKYSAIKVEQTKLRQKYRINVDDLEQIPGQGRKRKKKPKKVSVSMSVNRVSNSDNKDLNVDVYDGMYCACCMLPVDDDVFSCGVQRGAWEVEEGVAQLLLGDASGASSGSSGSADIVTVTPMFTTIPAVAAASEGSSNGMSSTTTAVVPPNTPQVVSTALFPASPMPVVPTLAASYVPSAVSGVASATIIPGVTNTIGNVGTAVTSGAVSGGASGATIPDTPPPTPAVPVDGSAVICSVGVSDAVVSSAYSMYTNNTSTATTTTTGVALDGANINPATGIKSVDLGMHVTLSQQIGNASSSENLVTLPLLAPITGMIGDSGVVGGTGGGGTGGGIGGGEVMVVGPTENAHTTVTTATTTTGTSNAYKCKTCNLHIHKHCLIGHTPAVDADYHCDVCLLKQLNTSSVEVDVRCVLCPRRGGYLKRTTDFKWAHVYCAHSVPGQVTIVDNKIDIRALPSKKEKCVICNRKSGVSVQCSHVGCTTTFHPLCAARSGKGCVRSRLGEKAAYCFAHLPEGVERMPSGHWVDGFEIERLRYGLERARLILDVLIRREKYKRMLCKAETELLSLRFHKALDKAKKRKHSSGEEVDLSDMSLADSDSDNGTDSDEEGFGSPGGKHSGDDGG